MLHGLKLPLKNASEIKESNGAGFGERLSPVANARKPDLRNAERAKMELWRADFRAYYARHFLDF